MKTKKIIITFIKNDENIKFNLYPLKVSANAKIASNVLKISWGQMSPMVARLLRNFFDETQYQIQGG